MSDQAEPIGAEGVVAAMSELIEGLRAGLETRCGATIEDDEIKILIDGFDALATRTPDPKAAGVEREAIAAMARAMCDRVNGQGDFDDNIAQRRKGWEAQAECALAALRAVDAAPGGGQAKDFCAENAQKSPDLHALEAAAKEIERVTALNVKARRDRADDTLAFEFQGLGDVLAKAVRDLSTPTAAPAPNVQALVEALKEALAAEDAYWPARRSAELPLPYPDAKNVPDAASSRRDEARRRLAAIQAPAGEGVA